MQSKTFSKISFLGAVIVTGFIFMYVARESASVVPPPDFLVESTSTPIVETTSVQVAAAGAAGSVSSPVATSSRIKFASSVVKTPKGGIRVDVATSSEERAQGLSGRASLPKTAGMLFSFETPGEYGFWMKDMNFSLDMIWISSDKKVAGIVRAASPQSYPDVFYPPSEIKYVLELNTGGAAQWGIATGTQLVF